MRTVHSKTTPKKNSVKFSPYDLSTIGGFKTGEKTLKNAFKRNPYDLNNAGFVKRQKG